MHHYQLHHLKLFRLMHDDRKPLADDAWIIVGSRIRRISFLDDLLDQSMNWELKMPHNYNINQEPKCFQISLLFCFVFFFFNLLLIS